jgi:hypothetical protein
MITTSSLLCLRAFSLPIAKAFSQKLLQSTAQLTDIEVKG